MPTQPPLERTYLAYDGHSTLEKRGRVAPTQMHRHPEVQFTYVLEGWNRGRCTGVVEELGPGEAAFVNSMQEHSGESADGTPLRLYCLLLLPCSATFSAGDCLPRSNPLADIPALRFVVFRRDDPKAANVLAILKALSEGEPPAGDVAARQDAYRNLMDAMFAFAGVRRSPEASVRGRAAMRCAAVRDCIAARFADDIDANAVARECGFTETELRASLAACGEKPFPELLRDFRLEQARWLVLRTDEPVKNLAGKCGYSSASNLSRAFLERYGNTPAGMRRAVQRLDAQEE